MLTYGNTSARMKSPIAPFTMKAFPGWVVLAALWPVSYAKKNSHVGPGMNEPGNELLKGSGITGTTSLEKTARLAGSIGKALNPGKNYGPGG